MAGAVDADVVILGAGCAGLSLATRLASGSGLRVIALESRTEYMDDRSWCFWRPIDHDLSDLVSKMWTQWHFSGSDGRSETHSVPGLAYQYIRSSDFYARSIERIERTDASRITLHTGVNSAGLEAVDGGVRVETDLGSILARNVIDTRPRRSAALLYQCFAGVEIETDTPHPFDPEVVGLMTSMGSDAAGLGFVYTLPLDRHRALVEWTRFSDRPLGGDEIEAGLDAVLARLGLSGARVVRSEGGVLGMGLAPSSEPHIPGVVVAGNAGGAVRAASGYAFLRIQRWAVLCAEALAASGAPVAHPAEPFARREMDRIFLQAVRAHPERTAEYFMALAHGVPARRLVRFLGDHATAGDYARIIASLPLLPFLEQIPRRRVEMPTLQKVSG